MKDAVLCLQLASIFSQKLCCIVRQKCITLIMFATLLLCNVPMQLNTLCATLDILMCTEMCVIVSSLHSSRQCFPKLLNPCVACSWEHQQEDKFPNPTGTAG